MQNTNQIYAHIFMIRKFESLQMDFYRIIKIFFFFSLDRKKRQNPFDRFLIAKYKNCNKNYITNCRSRNKKKRKPNAHETILNLEAIKKA